MQGLKTRQKELALNLKFLKSVLRTKIVFYDVIEKLVSPLLGQAVMMNAATVEKINPKIMVVEDDPDIRALLTEVLQYEEYDVLEAANGVEAMIRLNAGERPNLIFLDLMLPLMSGWELLSLCRNDPKLANIPVVILSAVANKETAKGADDFLRKPVDLPSILEKVKTYCRPLSTLH